MNPGSAPLCTLAGPSLWMAPESPIWTLGEPPLMPLPLSIGNLIPEDTPPWEVYSGIVAISLAFSPLRFETSFRNYVIYMCNREYCFCASYASIKKTIELGAMGLKFILLNTLL